MMKVRKHVWQLVPTDEYVEVPVVTPPVVPDMPPSTAPIAPAITPVQWTGKVPVPVATTPTDNFRVMDHPYIGGRFTIFVLSFGDNVELLFRCLSSITATCPEGRIDLRIGLNQPSAALERMAAEYTPAVYVDHGDRRKYPAMRAMFYDDKRPIETEYLCWFDDDSWCRKKNWMEDLSKTIIANHPTHGRLYGARMVHDLMHVKRPEAQREKWFQAAPWWRGRNLYAAGGARLAPNGSQIVFASGGFWALSVDVMREADIPDQRLNHNGGDITIGCQVTQAGYKVVNFSPRPEKAIIAWSDAPRRGYREDFPWA